MVDALGGSVFGHGDGGRAQVERVVLASSLEEEAAGYYVGDGERGGEVLKNAPFTFSRSSVLDHIVAPSGAGGCM